MSDSQVPIDYQINEAGLFSSFNERLQAIDSSLAWLMVKSLRRQGESVAKKDGSKTHSSRFPSGFDSSPQDTRMRSSSFSGRPTSRASSSSSSTSSAASMPLSLPPSLHSSSSSLPPPSDIGNSPLSLPLSSDHHNSPFSESCRCAHEDPSSTSPSVRAREDSHHHRYHTTLHHYGPLPYPTQYESYDTTSPPPPPPPLPPPTYFSPYQNPPAPPPLPPPSLFTSPYPPPTPPFTSPFPPHTPPFTSSDHFSHPQYPSFHYPSSPPTPLFHHKVEEESKEGGRGDQHKQEKGGKEEGREVLEEMQMKAQEQVERMQMQEIRRREQERQEDVKRKEKWMEGQTCQEESYGDPQEDEYREEKEREQGITQQETEHQRELQIEDLVQPEMQKIQKNNNEEITQQVEDTESQQKKTENQESKGNEGDEEKATESFEREERGEREQKENRTPQLKPRSNRHVSRWIHSDESDDSNDDVVLPKDLPPPPISPSISPHQLTKPSPNSSEKVYQEFVDDLTSRTSASILSSKSSGRNKLRPSSSTSNLQATSSTAYPSTPSRTSSTSSRPSSSSSRPSSSSSSSSTKSPSHPPALTRSLPPSLPPTSPSSVTPNPRSASGIQHMSRSLSNLEWRTALAHSAGVASRQTRSNSDADEALLREELRYLRESLRSLERPQHRAQGAAQESHEVAHASPAQMRVGSHAEHDARGEYSHRPGTAPTAARPPPSPASTRTNLDDSLREEVRHLTDNLRGLSNTTTRSSRSMSDYGGEYTRSLRTSGEFHDAHARENAFTSNIRLSDEAHDTRTHEDAYAAHTTLASENTNEPPRARRRRNNSEGGVPLEEENLNGSFVIPLSYNEYISVLAKRYQDKASHITKPSPNVSLPVPSTSKKVNPKKKSTPTNQAGGRKARSTEWN